MVGGAVMSDEQAMAAQRSVQQAVELTGCEQVIIGTSPYGLLYSWSGWGGARPRFVVGSGVNGADLALLEVLREERIEERFDRVVVASGDGIFTDAVARLGAAGVEVTVVARSGHCARRLQMAAGRTVFLSQDPVEVGGVA